MAGGRRDDSSTCGMVPADDKSTRDLPKASVDSEATRTSLGERLKPGGPRTA